MEQVDVGGIDVGLLAAFRSKKRVHMLFDDQCIRYLETNEAGIHAVKAIGERALPKGMIQEGKIFDPDGLLLILEQCVAEWKLKNKKVAFIVPDAYLLIRQVEVPLGMKKEEIKGYLHLEIGLSIHLPFDIPIIDYINIGQDDEHQQILLIAAPEELVSQYSSLLEAVKLQPTVADVSSLANYRLYRRLGYVQQDDHLLELQINLDSISVCVFHENKPMFFRHIHLNTTVDWESREESAALDLEVQVHALDYENWLQELLAELERIINFYHFSVTQSRYTVDEIVLIGGHPLLSEVRSRIEERMQVPVQEVDEETLTTMNNEPIPQRYYSLLGLALREVI